jgi:uncharacterized protein (DUF1800 family)
MLHEPGTKTVLNERYKEDGLAEGEHAIRALCRHPSTARFVATKLATHFISDDPPAAQSIAWRCFVERGRSESGGANTD